jgi:hypothetical protein
MALNIMDRAGATSDTAVRISGLSSIRATYALAVVRSWTSPWRLVSSASYEKASSTRSASPACNSR